MELADAEIDKYDLGFHRCFTKGRHLGHRCFFVSQRAAQVHPAIRENCASLALFTVQADPAKMWAKEFNDMELLKAVNLPPHYCYYKASRYMPARPIKID